MHINKINNKKYIGITCVKPERRWRNGQGYYSGYFHNAIQKYGFDNLFHEIFYINLSEKDAKNIEMELIKKYNTNNSKFGYNMTNGGDGCFGMCNEKHPLFGTHLSDETKEKLRNYNLGKELSEFTKKKMGESRTGAKNHKAKKVIQYEIDGTFIRTWDCMSDAARELNISYKGISNACRGKSKSSGNYKWNLEENP